MKKELNKQNLISKLSDGCKVKEKWRIGTEHEKFGYIKRTKLPLPYSGECSITSMLEGLSERFNWSKVYERKKLQSYC